MTTMYIPKNINQTFILIIYPNNLYLLLESIDEEKKQKPMYMGIDRLKLEKILKSINTFSDRYKYQNTKLVVYHMTEDGLDLDKQSSFYNLLGSK